MSSRLTAISNLYRYACFNKQKQHAECLYYNSKLNAAAEEYKDAVSNAAQQGRWKSVSAYERIDLSLYIEALKHEAAALDFADQVKNKMILVESELSSAKEELVHRDSIAKSVERRLNSLKNHTELSDEMRSYDQQNDLRNSSRSIY